MKYSKIEWTDHTFNPWEGCTRVSPGCAHCYAETRNARFGGGTAPNWGPGAPRRRTSAANWAQPLKWDREAAEASNEFEIHSMLHSGCPHYAEPRRPRVFCASLADWLDDEVPIEWLTDLLDLIRRTPNLDWLLLTKRPQIWKRRMMDAAKVGAGNHLGAWFALGWGSGGDVPSNVWIGTTVEDQARADERIPALLKIPARVRFLSCEPLLGPLHLRKAAKGMSHIDGNVMLDGIHWVIVGGESGPGARPMHPNWARYLRDQSVAAGVAFLFKQWGEWAPIDQPWEQDSPKRLAANEEWLNSKGGCGFHGDAVWRVRRVGKHAAGRLLDGREHNEFPEVRRG